MSKIPLVRNSKVSYFPLIQLDIHSVRVLKDRNKDPHVLRGVTLVLIKLSEVNSNNCEVHFCATITSKISSVPFHLTITTEMFIWNLGTLNWLFSTYLKEIWESVVNYNF